MAKETREETLARMARLREARKAKRDAQPNVVEVLTKQAKPADKRVNSDPELSEMIPPNLFSGTYRRRAIIGKNGSATDPIPGYRLYAFTDTSPNGGRIKQAIRSGYTFVTVDEVFCNENMIGGTDDVGNKIRMLSNINSGRNGEPPIYDYLMKIPLHIWNAHQAEHERLLLAQEAQIKGGLVSNKSEDRQYAPGQIPGSNLPPIEIGNPKSFVRRS